MYVSYLQGLTVSNANLSAILAIKLNFVLKLNGTSEIKEFFGNFHFIEFEWIRNQWHRLQRRNILWPGGGGSPLREGDGRVRHFLGPSYRSFLRSWLRFSNILSAQGSIFKSLSISGNVFSFVRLRVIKMRHRVSSRLSKMRSFVRSR